MLIQPTEQGGSRTFLSCFMHWPRVLSLQSNKVIHLGTTQSVLSSHLTLHFQRIIKMSLMKSCFSFLISENWS